MAAVTISARGKFFSWAMVDCVWTVGFVLSGGAGVTERHCGGDTIIDVCDPSQSRELAAAALAQLSGAMVTHQGPEADHEKRSAGARHIAVGPEGSSFFLSFCAVGRRDALTIKPATSMMMSQVVDCVKITFIILTPLNSPFTNCCEAQIVLRLLNTRFRTWHPSAPRLCQ